MLRAIGVSECSARVTDRMCLHSNVKQQRTWRRAVHEPVVVGARCKQDMELDRLEVKPRLDVGRQRAETAWRRRPASADAGAADLAARSVVHDRAETIDDAVCWRCRPPPRSSSGGRVILDTVLCVLCEMSGLRA